MSDRSQDLADQFDQVNQEVAAFVQDASDEDWARECPANNCTVAALAAHIGESHRNILEYLVQPLVNGETPGGLTPDDLNRANAQRATVNAARPKADVLALLESNGRLVSDYIRSLGDEQLARTGVLPFGGDPVPAEGLIVGGLIGHPKEHLATLRALTA